MVFIPNGATTGTLHGDDLFVNRTARDKGAIKELIEHLEAMAALQRDYVVPATHFRYAASDNGVTAAVDLGAHGSRHFTLRPVAHDQVGVLTGIPGQYYDRMEREAPGLLAQNVNNWFPKLTGPGGGTKNVLVRTTGDYLRAVLSDVYLPLDNVELFYNTFKASRQVQADIIRAQLSEKRFYVALVKPDWATQIEQRGQFTVLKDATAVVPIATVSNSEVGHGGLTVDFGLFQLICMNENVWVKSLARVHRGKRLDVGFISDATRKLEVELIWSTVQDAITAAFDRNIFDAMVEAMSAGTALVIDEPVTAVEELAKEYTLSETEREALLNEFVSPTVGNYGPTATGLMSAFSLIAQQAESPERERELSRNAGDFLQRMVNPVGGKTLVAVR